MQRIAVLRATKKSAMPGWWEKKTSLDGMTMCLMNRALCRGESRANAIRMLALVVVAGLLTAQSCPESSSSTSYNTDELSASFDATADDSGNTEVTARLTVRIEGLFTSIIRSVQLNKRDVFVATYVDPVTMKEIKHKMVPEMVGSRTIYTATLAGNEKDAIIRVALKRGSSSRVSAPNSRATLPTPFVLDWVEDPITMTPAPINFSRSSATPYFVVWDPFEPPDFEPGDEFRYSVTGSCIERYSGFILWQNGQDALELTGVLQDAAPPNDGSSCVIEVELRLESRGVADSAYESAYFIATQVRVLSLVSSP